MKIFSHIDGAIVSEFIDGKNHFFKFKHKVPQEVSDKIGRVLLENAPFLEKYED